MNFQQSNRMRAGQRRPIYDGRGHANPMEGEELSPELAVFEREKDRARSRMKIAARDFQSAFGDLVAAKVRANPWPAVLGASAAGLWFGIALRR